MRTSEQLAVLEQVSHLSPEQRERLRGLLVADSAVQKAQLAEHQAAASQLAELTDADSVLERELAEAGATRAREAMAHVERALHRLDAGTYGTCERCGMPIPFERLEAIPSARWCVACPARRPRWAG